MKKQLKHIGIVLVAMFGIGYIASEIWPDKTANILLKGVYFSAGLERMTVATSNEPVSYLDGGQGTTIVFLHGIFALKEHWIDVSRKLSGNYRVILLDLPGFGENQPLAPSEYNYQRQTQNVVEVLDKLGVEKFHIAASSMGAQIAAMIAIAHPERVQSIAFIGSPVGVVSPIPSDMDIALKKGKTPLVVTNAEEYTTRMEWLFPKVPFVPRPIARSWLNHEVSHAEINLKIWDSVTGSNVQPLEKIAGKITHPTLTIWCQKDRIFHQSGASVLDNALPNNKLITPKECGHLPMLDRASETGIELRNFLNEL